MQNVSQLGLSIDSLSKKLAFRYENFGKNFYTRTLELQISKTILEWITKIEKKHYIVITEII